MKYKMNTWYNRSKNYVNLKWTKREALLEVIRKECRLTKDATLCDVGTGTGIVASYLQSFCKSINAIDTSVDMLARAKFYYEDKDKICFHQMDAEKMDFASGAFDRVVSRMCFHHIDNLHLAMKECHRILKKGGRLVICEAIPPIGSYNFYKELFSFKENRHLFRAEDIIDLFEFHGFKNISYRLHTMKQVSIRNWATNNDLASHTQETLFNMWRFSAPYIIQGHNLTVSNRDVLADWLFIIVSGVK